MRHTLLASAALLGLALAAPAFAQTTAAATPAPASNIGAADMRSTIAPALPTPPIGENASPDAYLRQAQMAMRHHRSGEAQEALERAETRMLDRSTAPDASGMPNMSPRVQQVSKALDALGHRDWARADEIIAGLLAHPVVAANDSDPVAAVMPVPTSPANGIHGGIAAHGADNAAGDSSGASKP